MQHDRNLDAVLAAQQQQKQACIDHNRSGLACRTAPFKRKWEALHKQWAELEEWRKQKENEAAAAAAQSTPFRRFPPPRSAALTLARDEIDDDIEDIDDEFLPRTIMPKKQASAQLTIRAAPDTSRRRRRDTSKGSRSGSSGSNKRARLNTPRSSMSDTEDNSSRSHQRQQQQQYSYTSASSDDDDSSEVSDTRNAAAMRTPKERFRAELGLTPARQQAQQSRSPAATAALQLRPQPQPTNQTGNRPLQPVVKSEGDEPMSDIAPRRSTSAFLGGAAATPSLPSQSMQQTYTAANSNPPGTIPIIWNHPFSRPR